MTLSILISFLMSTQAAFAFAEKASEGDQHMNDVMTPIALNRFAETVQLVRDPSQAAAALLGNRSQDDIQYFKKQMKKIGSLPQPKIVGNTLVFFEGKDAMTIEFVDLLQRKYRINGKPLTLDPKMPLSMLSEIIDIKYLSQSSASMKDSWWNLFVPQAEAGVGSIGKKAFKRVLTKEEIEAAKKDNSLLQKVKDNKGFIASIAIVGPPLTYMSNSLFMDLVVAICQAGADANPKWAETWNSEGLCKAWFASKDQKAKVSCEPGGLKPFEITSPQHETGTWTRWVGATPEKAKGDDAKVLKAAFEIRESELDADKENGVLKAVYNFKYDPDTGKPRLIEVDFPSTEGKLKSLRREQLTSPEDRKLWLDLTQMTDAIRAAINECEKDLYKNQIERKHREIQDKIPAMQQTPDRTIKRGEAAH